MSAPLYTIVDLATPRLQAILRDLAPAQRRPMMIRLGKQLEVELKAHFAAREQEGNKRGFPRTHWWAREVRGQTALRSATGEEAVVGIASRQFAFRLRGGTIKPGPGKRFLAIPLRPEASGVLPRAGTIPGLFFIRSKALGKGWLAAQEGAALRFYYRLVPSVTQKADPRALPPLEQLRAALQAKAEQELARVRTQNPA
jgi:hypothetical protein